MISRARWLALGVLIGCALGSPILLFVVTRPSPRVIHTWRKEPAALYDNAQIFLSVVESGTDWRGFPLSMKPTYFIYIGRDSGTPSYGHEMPFHFDDVGDLETAVRASTVTWTPEGALFVARSGHRLFFPRASFLGGR